MGGVQARIATLDLMHQRMFNWLDTPFGMRRLTEYEKDWKKSTFLV